MHPEMTHSKRSISKALVSLSENNLSATEPISFSFLVNGYEFFLNTHKDLNRCRWGLRVWLATKQSVPFCPLTSLPLHTPMTSDTMWAHPFFLPPVRKVAPGTCLQCHLPLEERHWLKPALPLSTEGVRTLGAEIMILCRIYLNWCSCICSMLGNYFFFQIKPLPLILYLAFLVLSLSK